MIILYRNKLRRLYSFYVRSSLSWFLIKRNEKKNGQVQWAIKHIYFILLSSLYTNLCLAYYSLIDIFVFPSFFFFVIYHQASDYFCTVLWEKVKKKVDTHANSMDRWHWPQTRAHSDAVDNNFIVLLFIIMHSEHPKFVWFIY